jgi:hypothetical protein
MACKMGFETLQKHMLCYGRWGQPHRENFNGDAHGFPKSYILINVGKFLKLGIATDFFYNLGWHAARARVEPQAVSFRFVQGASGGATRFVRFFVPYPQFFILKFVTVFFLSAPTARLILFSVNWLFIWRQETSS